jgi:hypothetical protein
MTRRLFSLFALVAATAVGCTHRPAAHAPEQSHPRLDAQRAQSDPGASSSHAPGASDKPGANVITPVVYAPRDTDSVFSGPAALSPAQIATVLNAAAKASPGARPWFALVTHSETSWLTWRHSLSAIVYYAPDRDGRRVRRGRCCVVHRTLTSDRALTFPYAQVSEPGTVFGESLEVPELRSLPFFLPLRDHDDRPAMSDEDLAELLDAARSGLRRDDGTPDHWKYDPVERIEERGGRVEVHFGWPPHGGPVAFLERTAGGFRYAGTGAWVY